MNGPEPVHELVSNWRKREKFVPVCSAAARRSGSGSPAAAAAETCRPSSPSTRLTSADPCHQPRGGEGAVTGRASRLDYRPLCHLLMRLYAPKGGGANTLQKKRKNRSDLVPFRHEKQQWNRFHSHLSTFVTFSIHS